jgi:hypothetical protein
VCVEAILWTACCCQKYLHGCRKNLFRGILWEEDKNMFFFTLICNKHRRIQDKRPFCARGVYSGHFPPPSRGEKKRHFLEFGEENRPLEKKNSEFKIFTENLFSIANLTL